MKNELKHKTTTAPAIGAIPCCSLPLSVVYNQRCEIGMKQFPDKYFKLAPVDPPYFSGPEKRQYYGQKISNKGVKRIDYPVTETWEIPGDDYFEELFRVSEQQIIWGANYFTFKDIIPFKTPRRNEITDFIKKYPTGWIIWDKCNGDSSFNDFELAWTSFNEPTRVYQYMWNGMMQGKSISEGHIMQGNKKLNEKKIHPTQKPVNLYKWLLREYANEGDNILDTHVGSASSRLASYDLGFDFVGFEINPIHFANQEKRYKEHISQQRMSF